MSLLIQRARKGLLAGSLETLRQNFRFVLSRTGQMVRGLVDIFSPEERESSSLADDVVVPRGKAVALPSLHL